jgi:hypothetical protein
MEAVEAARPEATGRSTPQRGDWLVLTLAGSAAFWTANFVISLTPAAAAYRTALSIEYLPMLAEAAVGGVVVAGAVALLLLRLRDRVPGSGPTQRALLLATGALVLLTLVVEVPSKLLADVADPLRWFLVATVINTIRVLALGLAVGLLARARDARRRAHAASTEEAP